MTKSEIRLSFNIAKWKPSGIEWAKALSLIQEEEHERIHKFIFKRDAKASFSGRLIVQKLIKPTFHIKNEKNSP